jgi:NAD-dependent DNA ligase
MNKDQLIKIIKKIKVNKYTINIIIDNKPLNYDQEYDILKNEILILEKKYPFLSDQDSPS